MLSKSGTVSVTVLPHKNCVVSLGSCCDVMQDMYNYRDCAEAAAFSIISVHQCSQLDMHEDQ